MADEAPEDSKPRTYATNEEMIAVAKVSRDTLYKWVRDKLLPRPKITSDGRGTRSLWPLEVEKGLALLEVPIFYTTIGDMVSLRVLLDGKDLAQGRGYNSFWIDPGNNYAMVKGTWRTSWIVDPPNGQVPMKAGGNARGYGGPRPQVAAAKEPGYGYNNPEERNLNERCLILGTSGPPIGNYLYNNNTRITQSPDYVVIESEMIHDARVIPLNAKHKPKELAPWMGDSIGRWEGNTLVVDTLGYNGLGDVFVFLFLGLVAVCGTVFVQSGGVSSLAVLCAVPLGALATAVLVVNNVRDVDTDRRAGKRTLAVRWGKPAVLLEYHVLSLLAYAVPAVLVALGRLQPWALLPLLTMPMSLQLNRALRSCVGAAHNPLLKRTAQLLLLFGVLWAAGIALSKN